MIYKHTLKKSMVLLLILLLPGCNPFGSTTKESTDEAIHHTAVKELKALSDFNAIVGNGKPTAAKFYAPWCPPCKRMAPIFAKIAAEYNDKINFISLSSENKNLNNLFDTHVKQGFPTFVYFDKNGEVLEIHPGGYSVQGLEEAVKKLL